MMVVFSTEARQDLRKIAAFIANDAPRRALSFVKELRQKAMQLAQTPFGFPVLPGREASGIRRRPAGNYLIFYIVRDNRVYVVRILNAAMDYEAILFGEDN